MKKLMNKRDSNNDFAKKICISMFPDLHDKLLLVSKNQDRTVSGTIRQALKEYFRKSETEAPLSDASGVPMPLENDIS